jgi:outer membrane protein OmpA-like peptidoglycan-associated protein
LSQGGNRRFHVFSSAIALVFVLVLLSTQRLGAALSDTELLRQHQAVRDALFKTLSASATNYTFKYVVIDLPAGTVPGKDFSIPVTHIRYDTTVLFAFNQFTLQPKAGPIIRDLAQVILKDAELRSLLIVGHTDSTGPDNYNVTLSKSRAFTVAQSLQAAGVNGKYIGIIPMGKEQPVTTNSTDDGRALNRRVEFFISDIPEATEKAVQLIPFNPCFRNDQNAGEALPAVGCDNTLKRIPIYSLGSDTKPRSLFDLRPIERPRLPDNPMDRPSLREFEFSAPNK